MSDATVHTRKRLTVDFFPRPSVSTFSAVKCNLNSMTSRGNVHITALRMFQPFFFFGHCFILNLQ